MHPRLRASAGLLLCLAGSFWLMSAAAPRAPWLANLEAAEPKDRANVLVKPPRELLGYLKIAQAAAAKEQYAEAIIQLRKILDPKAGDGFLPAGGLYGSQRTIKSEAVRLLDTFPTEGRQLYEIQCRAEVEQLLNDAIGRGDRTAWAEIAKNHLPSRIAADVVLLLVYDALDRSEPTEALAWLRFLETASLEAKTYRVDIFFLKAVCFQMRNECHRARETLAALKSIQPPVTFRVGNSEHSTADPADVLLASLRLGGFISPSAALPKQLDNWPIYRGNAARNASAAWAGPLGQQRWKLGTLDASEMQLFRTWKRTDAENEFFPSLSPLVVGDVLLARTPRRLAAFDLSSGRQLWENPPPIKIENAKEKEMQAEFAASPCQGIWEAAPFGQLSSNGSEVFLIDGMAPNPSNSGAPRLVPAAGRIQIVGPKPMLPYNRLVALNLRQQGKLVWSVGGSDGEDEPQLADSFFLGPPLPHDRRLYILAEKEGLIRLCALDGASGSLIWSLAVAQADSPITEDNQRRLAGASPSLADGILICPTSAGAVVAVDPMTRTLLWGFQYPVVEESVERGPMGLVMPMGIVQSARHPRVNRTVRDASVVLAAGRAIVLPVEAEQLFCLNAETGELLWTCPRDDMLFIAGVTADKVVLAGKRGLFARNLRSGKPAWRDECIELPGKSQIIGRGFLVGTSYYLPSTWKELVKFDLTAGRIVERFPTPTKSQLGNLTAVGKLLISHTGDAIQVFSPGEIANLKK